MSSHQRVAPMYVISPNIFSADAIRCCDGAGIVRETLVMPNPSINWTAKKLRVVAAGYVKRYAP
jgi:hypothetical protein